MQDIEGRAEGTTGLRCVVLQEGGAEDSRYLGSRSTVDPFEEAQHACNTELGYDFPSNARVVLGEATTDPVGATGVQGQA